MARAVHLVPSHFGRRDAAGGLWIFANPQSRRVDFLKRKSRREQLPHDLFALDDEEPERLAGFLFPQGAESLELGLGQHAGRIVVLTGRWQAAPHRFRPVAGGARS